MKTLNEISHELQQMAMNTAADSGGLHLSEENRMTYKLGHRDARHAIAEAVTAYFVELIESGAKLTEQSR